ncbi:NAD-dependent epimerase/dehydratase family protein, partial [Mobiluncus sp.]
MSNGCLVTGGAGFIGCALSRPLAERFDRVVALDNLQPQV